MAIAAFSNPVSGIWPLGKITVAAAGTSVPLNINVGAETQNSVTGEPSANVRQLIFTTPASNTLGIYILRRVAGQTISKANTGFIIAFVNPGQVVSLPYGCLGMGPNINIDDFLIDADTTANVVYAAGVTG